MCASKSTCDLCSEPLKRTGYIEISNVFDGQRHTWKFCHVCLYATKPSADQIEQVNECFRQMLGMVDGIDSTARH